MMAAILQELLHLLQVMIKKSSSESVYFIKSINKKPELKKPTRQSISETQCVIISHRVTKRSEIPDGY